MVEFRAIWSENLEMNPAKEAEGVGSGSQSRARASRLVSHLILVVRFLVHTLYPWCLLTLVSLWSHCFFLVVLSACIIPSFVTPVDSRHAPVFSHESNHDETNLSQLSRDLKHARYSLGHSY